MADPGLNRTHMVIDLGNTRLKMGIFNGDTLSHTEHSSSGTSLSEIWEDWYITWKPHRIALSSTASLDQDARLWIESHRVLTVHHGLHFPFEISYTSPETLGQDRLAAVSAVHALYKDMNVLVIDCGTCITYDVLLSDGVYLGGNISPGVRMRLRSMHEFTDRLPLVDVPEEIQWIGRSTREALQSGGIAMAIMEANGMIFYLKEKYGSLRTVLTGGDAGLFQNHLKGELDFCADLVLSGLNEILKNNEV